MNASLENVIAALWLSDSDIEDMLTSERGPFAPIGSASRRHSNSHYFNPTGRLDDEETVHVDTPNPSGKALMYEDPDSDE